MVRIVSRLVLVVAVLCVSAVPGVAASTGCSSVGTGCVEVAVTPIGGRSAVDRAVRVVQMNLCHSGVAHCYRGDLTVDEAVRVVGSFSPSVVTLNEVCSADVVGDRSLVRAAMVRLGHSSGDASVFALFAPAVDRRTGLPFRCVDGDLYGIGLIARGSLVAAWHYLYRDQLGWSPEERVAVCARTVGFSACTTHLESDDGGVAEAQCRELTSVVGGVSGPVVVAGDLNVVGVGFCVPSGWGSAGDGIVQHVLVSGFGIVARRIVRMSYTDHPALVVDLSRPRRPR